MPRGNDYQRGESREINHNFIKGHPNRSTAYRPVIGKPILIDDTRVLLVYDNKREHAEKEQEPVRANEHALKERELKEDKPCPSSYL